MIKVVWLIKNLVPYHHARYEAFASSFSGEAHLIQVTNRDPFGVLEFKAPKSSYVLHSLFPERNNSDISSVELWQELGRCLEAIDPDCVCVSGWGMTIGRMMELWALRSRVPTVIFSESTEYDFERSFLKEGIKKQLVRAASSALVGGQAHREYMQQLGMDTNCIFLGHNVVDSSHFSAPAVKRPDSLPDWFELNPYFLVCTRFGQKKNIPSLVRAYALYYGRSREEGDQAFDLVIAGDGELRGEIEATVAASGVADKVKLLGAVDYSTLPWLYQNAQAFVHASTTEQWGLVVNEAMAAGVPVLISRRCGCAPDLVINDENGFQFDPFSEPDMAQVLWKFHCLPEKKRVSMGECSRKIIAQWGPARFAEGLSGAVNQVVGKKGSAAWLPRLLLWMMLGRV